jgi:hypothetical protein
VIFSSFATAFRGNNPTSKVVVLVSAFLLPIRELAGFAGKVRFSLVNRLFFEARSNVLKAVISES